jgi:serine/threonine protein kinase
LTPLNKQEISTPEYLPPEVLLKKKGQNHPWSLDVWSLGIILIEMVISFPVYMAYKGRVTRGQNQSMLQSGILGDTGRQPLKINKM